ncbi:MAG: PKD domain-containing protein [Bacteroidia bacterium]
MLIKKLPLFFFCVFFHQFVFGQCSYNLPDTVCPLQNITITNPGTLSVGKCSHRLDSLESVQNLPPVSIGIYQFKMIKEDGRYFIYANENGNVNTHLYEFNSTFDVLLNSQVKTVVNDNCPTSVGFDMVKIDSVRWVAFKVDLNNNNLYKLSLDSLNDDSVDFQYIGNFGINQPVRLKIFGDYLFVCNNGDNSISKIHFDNTFQNILDSSVITGPFNAPRQMDVIYDCLTDSFFGYVTNYFGGTITRIDFGNSLNNNNPSTTVLTAPVGSVFGLKMYNQQNEWYCFVTNDNGRLKLLKLGTPGNLNPVVLLDTVPTLMPSPYNVELLNDSSVLHVISGYNLTHFSFAANCVNDNWAQGIDSVNFNFQAADTGMQYFEVATDGTDHITYYANDSVYIYIPLPIAGFTTTGTCEGLPVNFTDETELCYGNIITWQWTFGDTNTSTLQNPSHTYVTGGSYNVTLTVYAANGDSSTFTKNITVVPIPVAEYTPSAFAECAGYVMQFTDGSTAANDSVVNWLWHFGNQDSSTVQSPSYTFATSGSYDVQLIVTNSNGCVDSITKTINILPTPVALFSISGTCAGGTVIFTNLTDSATNPGVNYNWSFGDGNSSTVDLPAHVYTATDSSYLVQLTATAANGCSTTYTDNVIITHPALVSFTQTADTVCKNVPVTFTNTSTTQNINDLIVLKHWEFSDGFIIDNVDIVTHTFPDTGIYYVVLTVVTATYCDSSFSGSVTVLQNPAAGFTFTNACLNDSNLFVSTSVPVPGDNINTYSWNFGDGGTGANGTSTYHTYSDTGLYNASLTIISINGCIDSITKGIVVYPLPVANFVTPVLCSDSLTQFNDFSFINTNDTLNYWSWSFGNLNSSTLQNPSNNYSQPGNYNVELIVGTQKGCRDTITKPVTVKLSPSPSFSVDSICHGDFTHFYFIDLSPSTGLINAWNWNFGEFGSGNSTFQNPIHQYQLPATYNVTVTATDTNQCFKSYTQPVVIHANPVIGFTTSNPCDSALTIFTDSSTVAGDTIKQWDWVINSATVSTASTANYTFNAPGSYLVQLTVTSNAGCSSDTIKGIIIYANPVASFTSAPAYASPNQLVSFTNSSQNAVSYLWDFGDGFNSVLTSPAHAFADTNVYNIMLIAFSDKGCTDTAYASYNVLIPDLEIAVTDVNSQLQNNLLTLSAQLANLGNINIDNYKVVANVEGLPSLVEFSNTHITVASPVISYIFKAKVELINDFNPGYFCIEVQKPNGVDDGNLANNRLCKSIESSFGLLNITPNPTSGNIQLYINSPFDQEISIEIYDAISKRVLSNKVKVKKGFNNLTVESDNLNNGVYFLRLFNELTIIKSSFIKQ